MEQDLFSTSKDALESKSKEELITIIIKLQQSKELESYQRLYQTLKRKEKDFEENLKFYKQHAEKFLSQRVEFELKLQQEQKRFQDHLHMQQQIQLKKNKEYDILTTWIDRIVFILRKTDRPMNSNEILIKLGEYDPSVDRNKQNIISSHLTRAMKYGRIVGIKQRGQSKYLFCLPS